MQLLTPEGRCVAVGSAISRGASIMGTLDPGAMPEEMLAVFREFEEIVESQSFGAVDEAHARIAALDLRICFDGGKIESVADLQIYPSTGKYSVEVRAPIVRSPERYDTRGSTGRERVEGDLLAASEIG